MASDFGISSGNASLVRRVNMTSGAATTLLTVVLPNTGDYIAGEITYNVYCTDGTDVQNICNVTRFSAVNKAGTLTGDHTYVATNQSKNATGGTLTMTATDAASGTTATFAVTPTTSLTATSLYIEYSVTFLCGVKPSGFA